MCHDSALNLESSAGVPPAVARESRHHKLFLLFCCRLLCRFLRSSFLLGGFRFHSWLFRFSRHLLHFGLLLRQRRSLEALAVESDLGNAHRSVGLPVPAQLLVLLL